MEVKEFRCFDFEYRQRNYCNFAGENFTEKDQYTISLRVPQHIFPNQ